MTGKSIEVALEVALERDAMAEQEALAVHSLAREYRRMRLFMERMPSPECFDADSMLEVYDSWNRHGLIDGMEMESRR